jgi:cytochrome P450
MLDIANRDPEQFPHPNCLQFEGRSGEHLAFGAGLHSCVAAMLIRSAAAVATEALIGGSDFAERYIALPARCFGVRYLKSLIVVRS